MADKPSPYSYRVKSIVKTKQTSLKHHKQSLEADKILNLGGVSNKSLNLVRLSVRPPVFRLVACGDAKCCVAACLLRTMGRVMHCHVALRKEPEDTIIF